MRLSLGIFARDSAEYIEPLLRVGKSIADELVVGVDVLSCDRTEEICARYADKIFRLESVSTSIQAWQSADAWLAQQCSGDWILRLDQDELPSKKLVEALPRLLSNREVTFYWIARRWLTGQDRSEWIAQFPWWPDWQIRLWRNVRSLISFDVDLHDYYRVKGAGGYFSDGTIYHYDLVYRNEDQRRKKIELYEQMAPANGNEHFYYPHANSQLIRPVPHDDGPCLDYRSAPGTSQQRWRSLVDNFLRRSVKTDGRTGPPDIRFVSLAEMRQEAFLECRYGSDIFRASIECLNCPVSMVAESIYAIDLLIQNDSCSIWPGVGLGLPQIRICYHWLSEAGESLAYEGLRSDLPVTLRQGEKTSVVALVKSPQVPGRYVLKWDLVIEFVAWFSDRGWEGPQISVNVEF